MRLFTHNEPDLQFAEGSHPCPRAGISRYAVYDARQESRREKIHIGAVGNAEGIEKLHFWLGACSREIPEKRGALQPNLFPAFCGVNKRSGFRAEFLVSGEIARHVAKQDLRELAKIKLWPEQVEKAVDLFYREIKFLTQNRTVDVIVCVIPDSLYSKVSSEKATDNEEATSGAREEPEFDNDEGDDAFSEVETNFRRLLKARSMSLGKPIQIVREHSLGMDVSDQQDAATKAWNFCTALYYKSGQTIPWKMTTDRMRPSVCAIGVSFFRSRDRQTLHTSLAQMFDELGNGLILRGTPVSQDKDDRRPYLTMEQAGELLTRALSEYRDAVRTMPARVVIHKSSKFRNDELEGFRQAARILRVDAIDFVTVLPSRMRLFRGATYPPYRGVRIELSHDHQLLYTRGSVPYYSTYPGRYLPEPLEVRIVESEESPGAICEEVLALTKMNWNNTQFDGKEPVTIGCSRKVGEILKYMGENEMPQIRYSYYM